MRCAAVLGSGVRCGHEAAPGEELCARHRSIAFGREARAFYLARLSAEDEGDLGAAAELKGLDTEIAMLRVLIRRAAGGRDVEAARRGIDSLRRALETRARLEGLATQGAGASLDAALERLDREAGAAATPPPAGRGREPRGVVAASPGERMRGGPSHGGGSQRPTPSPTLPRRGGGGNDSEPALEGEAARLALRYQAGEGEALRLLYGLVEVTILGVLLNERAFRRPAAMTLEEIQDQSRLVLGELARQWRPGVSFLGYLFRTFPGAMGRQMRRAGSWGGPPPPSPSPVEGEGQFPAPPSLALPLKVGGDRSPPPPSPSPVEGEGQFPAPPSLALPLKGGGDRSPTPPSPSPVEGEGWSGPYSAEDLAALPELERQILVLRAFGGESMRGIARRVGVPEMAAYKLYQRARQRLEGRGEWPESYDSTAMRRLVDALHLAAGPNGRLPSRAWAMAAAGLKRLEYDQLVGRLEGTGAIEGRSNRKGGRLVERDAAATLARVANSPQSS